MEPEELEQLVVRLKVLHVIFLNCNILIFSTYFVKFNYTLQFFTIISWATTIVNPLHPLIQRGGYFVEINFFPLSYLMSNNCYGLFHSIAHLLLTWSKKFKRVVFPHPMFPSMQTVIFELGVEAIFVKFFIKFIQIHYFIPFPSYTINPR